MPLFARRRSSAVTPAAGEPAGGEPAVVSAEPDLHAAYRPPAPRANANDGAEPTEVRIVGVEPPAPAERGAPAANGARGRVSAAWELEMLISGALTYALVQGPRAVHAVFESVIHEATPAVSDWIIFARLYAGAMLWVLIVAFILHLVARAYWVGLVGLGSVFPGGPRWDRYRAGPFTRGVYQARVSSLPQVTERVDNFASVLFSFAFLVVLLFLVSAAALTTLYGVGWLVAHHVVRDPGKVPAGAVMVLLTFGLLLAQGLFTVADRTVGRRLAPGGRAARVMRALARGAYVASGAPIFGPIMATLATNARRGFYPLFVGAIVLSVALGLGELMVRNGRLRGRALTYVPEDPDYRGRHAVHYQNLRDPDDRHVSVMIQSDVVAEPYLRLFVPYVSDDAAVAVPHACPGTPAVRPAPPGPDTSAAAKRRVRAQADEVIRCLTRLHAVTLDGRPVPDVRWRFAEHREDGWPGLAAYVDVAGLARGEHEVAVLKLPREVRGRWVADTVAIPFWR